MRSWWSFSLKRRRSRSCVLTLAWFEKHEAFCCCYSELGEETVHTTLGEDCAKAFLDDIAEKHGKAKQLDDPDFKPPVVKLLAHNITYDLSFL